MATYTILISREVFVRQEVEADSEDDIYAGDYKVLSEEHSSTAPDEVMRVETSIRQVEMIDLKVGMVYRNFRHDHWSTVKDISYSFKRGVISGVDITNVEGGGCSSGAGDVVYVKEDNRDG